MPEGPLPEYGVYLQVRRPPMTPWSMVWVKWPDFRVPADRRNATKQLVDAFELAGSQRVEVACRGGRGRTGTALAVMAIAAGVDRDLAVDWVRCHYHRSAVETRWQPRACKALLCSC